MKKIILVYFIILMFLIILLFTGGIPCGIVFSEHNMTNISEPTFAKESLLIVNVIIMLICLFLSIVVTANKVNSIKAKWIIPGIVLILLLFIPVVRFEKSGGVVGYQVVKNESLIETITRYIK